MFVQRKKYKTDRNVHHVQQRVKIDRHIETVWLSCKTTILPGCKPPSATLCGSVISPDNKTWIMPDAHICQTQYTHIYLSHSSENLSHSTLNLTAKYQRLL
ncbi:hypothetical protein T08_2632 [Trichinella sp. T8]|nr:hypothetical protein T08_2632 [Trichinella sp. T8]